MWLNLSNIVLSLLYMNVCLSVFNGLQRSMSTACKHIVHNCTIFSMQNVLSASFYNFDIWFCNCSDSVVYICFFFIKAYEQIVKTKDYKNT